MHVWHTQQARNGWQKDSDAGEVEKTQALHVAEIERLFKPRSSASSFWHSIHCDDSRHFEARKEAALLAEKQQKELQSLREDSLAGSPNPPLRCFGWGWGHDRKPRAGRKSPEHQHTSE